MKRIASLVACLLLAADVTLADRSERPATARLGVLDATRFNQYTSPNLVLVAKAITEAEGFYKAEDFAKAQAAFAAIQAMPNAGAIKMWAACMEGMCLANQGKYDEGRAILRKVVDADPKSPDAAIADYAIGGSFKLAYDDDKAVAHFDPYLDNPERKKDAYYYNRALEWQTEQYRNRSTTNPDNAAVRTRFYDLLEQWVKAHPDRTGDQNLLYKFFRNQDKWTDCLRVAGYVMKPLDAAIHVLGDQLARTREICDASKLGAAEAAKAAKPRIDAFQAELANLKDVAPNSQRALRFQLVQTLLACGMPDEGDKAAIDWMAAHPDDRTALYMYIGYIRSSKAARQAALDRIVGDFLAKKPADDVRMELLDLYADVAVPLYKDKDSVEKILKQFDAPPSTMATLYTGWKDAESEAAWSKVLADTNALDELRFKAMMVLGDRNYEKGAVAQATNFYRMALDFTAINRKFVRDLERFRDRNAQSMFMAGMTNDALLLIKGNLNSQNSEYWTRANLFQAREHMKSKDVGALSAGDQALRRILGQSNRGGDWKLDIDYSKEPPIRAMQDEAKALCAQYELDLTRQPMGVEAWRARLAAKSKEDFDRRLKAQ